MRCMLFGNQILTLSQRNVSLVILVVIEEGVIFVVLHFF